MNVSYSTLFPKFDALALGFQATELDKHSLYNIRNYHL